jgi:hypothetical protein
MLVAGPKLDSEDWLARFVQPNPPARNLRVLKQQSPVPRQKNLRQKMLRLEHLHQ